MEPAFADHMGGDVDAIFQGDITGGINDSLPARVTEGSGVETTGQTLLFPVHHYQYINGRLCRGISPGLGAEEDQPLQLVGKMDQQSITISGQHLMVGYLPGHNATLACNRRAVVVGNLPGNGPKPRSHRSTVELLPNIYLHYTLTPPDCTRPVSSILPIRHEGRLRWSGLDPVFRQDDGLPQRCVVAQRRRHNLHRHLGR